MKENRKVVLSFIDWYRPGFKAGGTITAFSNFVDYLESDLNFKIITRDSDYFDTTPYPNIIPNTWTEFTKTSVYYISKSQVNYQTIKRLIFTNNFDWIYVNGIFSFYFSILPVMLSGNKKCMINPHGMLSDQAFSVKSAKKKIFLKLANALTLFKNSTFHVANEEEASDVRKRIKSCKAIKISNQLPRKVSFSDIQKTEKTLKTPIRMVTVSRISIEKGILVLIDSLATLKKRVTLDIYGPIYDVAYWKKCQEAIKKLPSNIHVNYKGSIHGDKIIDCLKDYDFFVLLSQGENFGHAILEAFSAGCPVIISDKTPWKNLREKKIGWEININDSNEVAHAFEEATNLEYEKYQIMSHNAIKFAREFSQNPELLITNLNLFCD